MVPLEEREHRLRHLLATVRDRYDFILIDTPPSLGLLTLNALVAADTVLIPLHCEYFALEGLADLMATLSRIGNSLNPGLDVEGVVLTMYGDRTNLGAQVAKEIRQFFEAKVFNTVIPRNVRLAEAPSHGLPVLLYDPRSRGAEAYVALSMNSCPAMARRLVALLPRRPDTPWHRNLNVVLPSGEGSAPSSPKNRPRRFPLR